MWRRLSSFLFVMCAGSACSDSDPAPTMINAPPAIATSRANAPDARAFQQRASRSKALRIDVDKGHRRIDISETMATEVDACPAGSESSCEPYCQPFSGECDTVDEPLDEGSRVVIGDASAFETELVECPLEINGGTYLRWRRHDFIVWGRFLRQARLRNWPWGEAEYALPMGPHESTDGDATIWSGVAKGKCFGSYRRGRVRRHDRDDVASW